MYIGSLMSHFPTACAQRSAAREHTYMRKTNPSKREASITHLDALRAKICVCEGLRQKLESDNNGILSVKDTIR